MSLYASPQPLITTIFSRLPEKYWRTGDSDGVKDNKPRQKVTSFLEEYSFDK